VTSDPDFKVTTFLNSNIVTIAQEETIHNIWNGAMFEDRD